MLELKVIGCYGAEENGKNLSSYILSKQENRIALDAGAICSLPIKKQNEIRNIYITHSHLDHTKDLPFFAYNNNRNNRTSFVHATTKTINAVKKLFRPPIWVPFHKFDSEGGIRFSQLSPDKTYDIEGYKIKAIPVNHNQSNGYLVDETLFYAGDTGQLDKKFWRRLNAIEGLTCIIIECTFPNKQRELASSYNHLCPEMLEKSIEMLARPDVRFLATHFLPEHEATIKQQLEDIKKRGFAIGWLEQGKTYRF